MRSGGSVREMHSLLLLTAAALTSNVAQRLTKYIGRCEYINWHKHNTVFGFLDFFSNGLNMRRVN